MHRSKSRLPSCQEVEVLLETEPDQAACRAGRGPPTIPRSTWTAVRQGLVLTLSMYPKVKCDAAARALCVSREICSP